MSAAALSMINNVGQVVSADAEYQTLEESERAWALKLRCAQQRHPRLIFPVWKINLLSLDTAVPPH
jgi:hypothetical protein